MENIIRDSRRCGNTTRQADQYIQLIFDNPNKTITIIDHASRSNNRMNEHLSKIIYGRLITEHRHCTFEVDKNKCTFKYISQ